MATSFDDRRKGFESKWAHDEELRFKVQARRNYLLGLWAAGEKGLTGDAADKFADEVVAADFQEPGEEDVFRKVRGELGQDISDSTIRDKMAGLLQVAAERFTKAQE